MGQQLDIVIVGLGYVGLPLAVELGKQYKTLGYDRDPKRIKALEAGHDRNKGVSQESLESSIHLSLSSNEQDLEHANVYIVTVPTPIDKNKQPDLSLLISATQKVGKVLGKGGLVIYESTVFPGCTEEVCVPILEAESGLLFNQDFSCGYSPERINPGDEKHRITGVQKVTSGSNPEAADRVDALYSSIIPAGTHRAESIKVAEAAKVIENCQRDINIAFVNELAMIFERLGLDTQSVLDAASTKWNFLPFTPGLVGGHCIGVDPYYLTYKAQEVGYDPQVILSGRRINDAMGYHIAKRLIKSLLEKGHVLKEVKALMLGLSYKENCPDIRNSKAVDLFHELVEFGLDVKVYDPWVDPEEVQSHYQIEMSDSLGEGYDLLVLAVAHDEFLQLDLDSLRTKHAVVFDIKSVMEKNKVTDRL